MSRGVGMRAPLPRNGLGPAGARRRAHMDREEEEGRVAPGECGSYLARRPPPPHLRLQRPPAHRLPRLHLRLRRPLARQRRWGCGPLGQGVGENGARVVGGKGRRMSSPAARSPSSVPPPAPPPPPPARSLEKMGMRTVGQGDWGKWGGSLGPTGRV